MLRIDENERRATERQALPFCSACVLFVLARLHRTSGSPSAVALLRPRHADDRLLPSDRRRSASRRSTSCSTAQLRRADLSRHGMAEPSRRLAESWTESADGLTWTVQLRPNAFFHDGTPVDSAAVKESLERSLNRRRPRSYRRDSRISSRSKHQLTDEVLIHAAEPFDIPSRRSDRRDHQDSVPDGTVVGTGPFVTASTSEQRTRDDGRSRTTTAASRPSIASSGSRTPPSERHGPR